MTYDDIIKGQLPGQEERENLLRGIVHLERISLPVSALLLADTLAEDFPGNGPGWMRWAQEVTGLEKCEIYHRAQIGTLLRALRGQAVVFRRLVKLSGDKLLAICRIKPERVPAFLSTCRPEELDRGQVRREVRRFLGLSVDDDRTPDLPGFEKALSFLNDMESEKLVDEIDSPARGFQYLNAGANLLGAYVEYQKKQEVMDIATLMKLKNGMLDQIAEIEEMIAGRIDDGDERLIQDGSCGRADAAGEETITTGLHTGPECGNHTDSELAGAGPECGNHTDDEAAGTASGAENGLPDGSAGTAAVPGSGGEHETPAAGSARSGSGAGRRRPIRGPVPDPADQRPRRQRAADLSELPELEKAAAPGVASGQSDQGGSAAGAGSQVSHGPEGTDCR